MTSYAMVINVALCDGCSACSIACRDEFVGNDFLPYSAAQQATVHSFYPEFTYQPGQSWMLISDVERGAYPKVKYAFVNQPCMQCRNPPCVTAATGGAATTQPNGIVFIDPTKSEGQTAIQSACPYGRVYWNPVSNIPQKCTFCAHLLAQGATQPKCVDVCPTTAITFGDLDNPTSAVSTLVNSGKASQLHPEYGTNPRVYYLNMPMTFLAGAVVSASTGKLVSGATVKLTIGTSTQTVQTNAFGDFEFDGLTANSNYQLQISAPNYTTQTVSGTLTTNTYLGKISG